ncbi:hypothetical protein C8R48DRAFT_673903 [Suillus tomentosus]|nr:hypothetical protein C8R48DRAFT_673903 [Suillus tomentosus]
MSDMIVWRPEDDPNIIPPLQESQLSKIIILRLYGWLHTPVDGGRVLGINSEMDALPGIGHACGHNLVGISGVAVAVAAEAAMERLNIDGEPHVPKYPMTLVWWFRKHLRL